MKLLTKHPQVKSVAVARFEAEVQQKIQHLVRVMSLVEEVNNEQDKAMVSAAVKEGKELIKKVGAARKAITTPLQEQIKQWIAKEKELLLPVEEAIHNADKLVQAFNARVARQQQEMLDQIARQKKLPAQEQEEKDTEQVRQDSEFRRQLAEAQHQTDGIRKVWAFDLEDLSQVPREYLVLDEQESPSGDPFRRASHSRPAHLPATADGLSVEKEVGSWKLEVPKRYSLPASGPRRPTSHLLTSIQSTLCSLKIVNPCLTTNFNASATAT